MGAAKGCCRCTSWAHQAKDCRSRRQSGCREKVGAGICGKQHLEMLHNSGSAYCKANALVNASVNERGELVLLGVQPIMVQGKSAQYSAILFHDSGSTLTLCRHGWAKRAGFVGRPVSIFLKVLTHSYERVDTMEYELELLSKDGDVVKVFAVGLDALTQEHPSGDLDAAYKLFPEVEREALLRPEGPVDILLGQDFAGYLPRVERSQGHLLLLRSEFGSGFLLSGRTGGEGGVVCDHILTDKASEYAKASRTLPVSAVLVNHVGRLLPTFFEAEEMPCPSRPECREHREATESCRECNFRGTRVSRRERESLLRMEESLFRRDDGKLQLQYPFNLDAYKQRDNRFQARQVQERVEVTIAKKGVAEEYKEEMVK